MTTTCDCGMRSVGGPCRPYCSTAKVAAFIVALDAELYREPPEPEPAITQLPAGTKLKTGGVVVKGPHDPRVTEFVERDPATWAAWECSGCGLNRHAYDYGDHGPRSGDVRLCLCGGEFHGREPRPAGARSCIAAHIEAECPAIQKRSPVLMMKRETTAGTDAVPGPSAIKVYGPDGASRDLEMDWRPIPADSPLAIDLDDNEFDRRLDAIERRLAELEARGRC